MRKRSDPLRFEFGKNWQRFIEDVNEDRVAAARSSLRKMLGIELGGKAFVDVGCGSGLFSLAARELGASVQSFDLDRDSISATKALRERHRPGDTEWTVEEGSALDDGFLRGLGTFDVVYAWGVLHHTGAMWEAFDNVTGLVAPGGKLFIALYNDQGVGSRWWAAIKRLYNQLPRPVRPVLTLAVGVYAAVKLATLRIIGGARSDAYQRTARKKSRRGMSLWHDLKDWVGGYPFEVAKPDDVVSFARRRGFTLETLRTVGGGLGCNEYVFARYSEGPPSTGSLAPTK